MDKLVFPNQSNYYCGKVRDVFTISNKWLLSICSNRISAFDVILPKLIPFKGQVLNQLAAFMLKSTKDVCPNWFLESPAPQASLGIYCTPIKIEVVVRHTLTGHAWRSYVQNQRKLCGITLPEGLKENEFFKTPIITPSTKAVTGHDEDISASEIIERKICTAAEWEKINAYAFALFERGRTIALKNGLILADTKYEFGKFEDEILLMDEVHTPDSSRFFYADSYYEKLEKNQKQIHLSKEFVREWLMQNNFMGKPCQQIPEMSEDWINTISKRYINLFELLTGEIFVPSYINEAQVFENCLLAVNKVNY